MNSSTSVPWVEKSRNCAGVCPFRMKISSIEAVLSRDSCYSVADAWFSEHEETCTLQRRTFCYCSELVETYILFSGSNCITGSRNWIHNEGPQDHCPSQGGTSSGGTFPPGLLFQSWQVDVSRHNAVARDNWSGHCRHVCLWLLAVERHAERW